MEEFTQYEQLIEHLIKYWGQEHITDGVDCFCWPTIEDNVVIHRRMPWENFNRKLQWKMNSY